MTLRGIDQNDAAVGLTLVQEAPKQEVPHPFVPGAKAVLEQFRGDGQGELSVDRITAIVVRGHLDVSARLTLSGDVQGRHGSVTLVGKTRVDETSSLLPEIDAGEDEPPPPMGAPSAAP
jgi:hypothetical protein